MKLIIVKEVDYHETNIITDKKKIITENIQILSQQRSWLLTPLT